MKPFDRRSTNTLWRALRLTGMLVMTLLAVGFFQSSLFALGQKAGSLLIFPIYDASPTNITIITVTNSNTDTTLDPNTGLQGGTVDVMFKYIDGIECTPENHVERLTPNDTLSVIPFLHNPQTGELGFLYVYAVDVKTGLPVAFNYLIGASTIFDSTGQGSFNLPPLAFKAGIAGPDDHKLALDGVEYEMMPDEILIPRFFGQGMGNNFQSPFATEIIFFNLTGGAMFTAVADVLIFNDNEQVFSSTVQFDCWETMDLIDVSMATNLAFLENTNNDPDEVLFGTTLIETGWLRFNGNVAYNAVIVFDDPAVYAILVEKMVNGTGYGTASLPFEKGEQGNGLLWAMSPNGKY